MELAQTSWLMFRVSVYFPGAQLQLHLWPQQKPQDLVCQNKGLPKAEWEPTEIFQHRITALCNAISSRTRQAAALSTENRTYVTQKGMKFLQT